MPDLEQIQAKFRTPRDETNSSAASSNNSSASRLNGKDDGDEDELAEFETKEFPSTSDHDTTSRNSAIFDDDISTSSSQEVMSGVSPMATPIISGVAPPPIIRVEGVSATGDDLEHDQRSQTKTKTADSRKRNNRTVSTSTRTQKDIVDSPPTLTTQQSSATSTTSLPPPPKEDLSSLVLAKANKIYGNPVYFWLLLVLAIIPIAYVIQLSIEASRL